MSIKIDLKILLFILLFCITSQIEMYLMLMIFALIHELVHLCIGLLLGFKLQEIQITPVGMRVEFKPKCEEYNKRIKKGNTLSIKRGIVAIRRSANKFCYYLYYNISCKSLSRSINMEYCRYKLHNNYICKLSNRIF